MAASSPSFVVEYCSSCDGGRQEEQTAINAIRTAASAVGIEANITSECSDDYPIIATVRTGDGKILWQKSQKKLYRKYPIDREQSIQEIQECVTDYLKGYNKPSV